MRSIIKKITPAVFRYYYQQTKQLIYKIKGVKRKRRLITYLQSKNNLPLEESELLHNLLKSNKITVFPYDYVEKYHWQDIKMEYDKKEKMYYTLLFGDKRLYFKQKMTKRSCAEYISSIACEQDLQSPHCYLSDTFTVGDSAALVDAGAAEGYFALSVIDKAQKIYLFEPDSEWRKALEATFRPWREKVEIVPKFVDVRDNETSVSLDAFFENRTYPTFIKADIEGFEKNLLLGAKNILTTASSLSIAICAYHRQNDYEDLSKILSEYNFSLAPSHGFMFLYTDGTFPYLRRGILRAQKDL